MFRHTACLGKAHIAVVRRCIRKYPNVVCCASTHHHNLIAQRSTCHAYFSTAPLLKVDKEDYNDVDNSMIESADTIQQLTLAKDERRKLHNHKYKQARMKKDLKHRRIIAEELMRIFATNNECLNMTLQELNVNTSAGPALVEYRQFYIDSLKSFGKMLAEDSDDELSQVGLSSDNAIQILDYFDKSLMSHTDMLSDETSETPKRHNFFSKRYRKHCAMIQREAEAQSNLKQLQQEHEQLLKDLKVEEELLEELESKDEDQQSSSNTVMSIQTDRPKARHSIRNKEENNYTDELDRLEKELEGVLGRVRGIKPPRSNKEELHKQQNKVTSILASISSKEKRINRIRTEITELEWPMSNDIFTSINETIMEITASLAPALAKFITHRHEDFDKYRKLEAQTDLTKPHEWYPRARLDKRKIIFHAGPTNSGKTYTALQRLKNADTGMYLAPLRLLAAEVYENLTAEGIYTDLLTGQEARNVPFSTHRSSTVELASLQQDYDVVVIDEIQMIGNEFRGFAWTRALLGVRCKEIHVCGGPEAIDIVRKMAKMCGDEFELHRYERFSSLKVLDNSLADTPTCRGSYAKVQPGDCVVAFSKKDIFAIKREIESITPYKCCVVYGSLPPDVRAEQARRFNDQNSEYQILVASDAIGMGLNLSIKRIIFNSMIKTNGERLVQVDHSPVKQIAGRAGRRNSAYPNGEVTCRDPDDMSWLKEAMSTDITPLKQAGLIPTKSHIESFAHHMEAYGAAEKDLQLHRILRKFSEMSQLKGDFFICRKQGMELISMWLKDIDNIPPADKFSLCMSPVMESCPKSKAVFMRYIETYANGKVPGMLRVMRPRPASSFDHLTELCSVHNHLELFIWLQGTLPSNAVEKLRALAWKETTKEMINKGLQKTDRLALAHDYVHKDIRIKKAYADENKI